MKKFLLLILLFLVSQQALAHPHTFIYSTLAPEFENNTLKGVWVEWTFDEMFSAPVISEADANKNKKIDKAEIDYIYNNAFINLENYGYFFYQRDGKNRIAAKEVQDFSASIKGDKIFYKFFVPIENKTNPLIISLIDSTFFCALVYNKTPVYFIKAENLSPQYKLVQNKDYPVYYNPAGAIDDDRIYTKWQQGLQTAYPEEIIISY